jgi:hypothetical protein
MIVLIVIGWAVALPLFVVLGLFCAAKVLSHRARVAETSGETDMTGFARQFPTVFDDASPASVSATSRGGSPSVGAGY